MQTVDRPVLSDGDPKRPQLRVMQDVPAGQLSLIGRKYFRNETLRGRQLPQDEHRNDRQDNDQRPLRAAMTHSVLQVISC